MLRIWNAESRSAEGNDVTEEFLQRDFLTLEDELPATVSWSASVPKEAATRLTAQKQDTGTARSIFLLRLGRR